MVATKSRRSKIDTNNKAKTDEVQEAKPSIQNLTENVFLYTTRFDDIDATTFTYEAECARMNTLTLTLDFSKSKNMEIVDGNGSMVANIDIKPFTRSPVCVLKSTNTTETWSLATSISVLLASPDEEFLIKLMEEENVKMEELLKTAKSLNFAADSVIASINELYAATGVSYIDQSFPPTSSSLFSSEALDAATQSDLLITWKRPIDFFSSTIYHVFEENIEPEDIRQGRLGDCWLLCAIAALSEYPILIKELFSSDSLVPVASGLYKLRICKSGQWRQVVVDDYFPCIPGAGPVYAKSHGNELWAMLIEKAYAKVHGSYSAIAGGWAEEAMMDLTGDPCDTYRFSSDVVKKLVADETFWNMIVSYDAVGYIITASTAGQDNLTNSAERPSSGLVPGHAYSLIAAKKLSNGACIVYIRNPWGSMEWGGDWGDQSATWTPELREEVHSSGLRFKRDDGAFWMSYEDMLVNFVSINVCKCRTPGIHPNPWKEIRKKSFFVYDVQNGDVTTYMFRVVVAKPTSAIFTIHQHDKRIAGSQPYIDFGVTILKVVTSSTTDSDVSEIRYEYVGSTGCTVERQCNIEVPLLEPGFNYIVVPITSGGKFMQQDRIKLPEGTTNDLFVEVAGEHALSFHGTRTLTEVFERFNMDMDGYLSGKEICKYLLATQSHLPIEKIKEKTRSILDTFDSTSSGLSLKGFLDANSSNHVNAFRGVLTKENKQKALLNDLLIMGYDEDLNLIGSRGVVLSIHSDEKISCRTVPFDTAVYEEAIELPIIHTGTIKQYDEIKLYTKKNGYAGCSFIVKNESPSTHLSFTMDVTGTNITSHRGTLKYTAEVPPTEAKVLHHLMPDSDNAGWSYKFAMSYTRLQPSDAT